MTLAPPGENHPGQITSAEGSEETRLQQQKSLVDSSREQSTTGDAYSLSMGAQVISGLQVGVTESGEMWV